MVSSVAACWLRPSYDARPTTHCQRVWLSSYFLFFLSLVPLTSDLGLGTQTRFLYSVPNRQIWLSYVYSFGSYRADNQTNKHADAAENIHRAPLRYATPVDNQTSPHPHSTSWRTQPSAPTVFAVSSLHKWRRPLMVECEFLDICVHRVDSQGPDMLSGTFRSPKTDCLEGQRENYQVSLVCNTVCNNCAQYNAHTYEQT